MFLKVDIDEAREAAAEWQIASIPRDEELQMRMNSLDKMILEHTA